METLIKNYGVTLDSTKYKMWIGQDEKLLKSTLKKLLTLGVGKSVVWKNIDEPLLTLENTSGVLFIDWHTERHAVHYTLLSRNAFDNGYMYKEDEIITSEFLKNVPECTDKKVLDKVFVTEKQRKVSFRGETYITEGNPWKTAFYLTLGGLLAELAVIIFK